MPPRPVPLSWSPADREPCLPNVTTHPSPVFDVTGKNTLTLRDAGKTSAWGTLCVCGATRPSQPTSCCSIPPTRAGPATWRLPTSTARPTWSSDESCWASPARWVCWRRGAGSLCARSSISASHEGHGCGALAALAQPPERSAAGASPQCGEQPFVPRDWCGSGTGMAA